MTFQVRFHSLRMRTLANCALSACIVAASAASTSATPQTEAELINQLRTVPNSQVILRLSEFGWSRAEVRDRLRQAGYDPFLADEYFAAMSRGAEMAGQAEPTMFEAFRSIGVLDPQSADDLAVDLTRPEFDGAASTSDVAPVTSESGLQVFGNGVFFHQSPRFDPFLSGPVGDDYELGPGDAITLVLTGDVELVHQRLIVGRSGDVYIPNVGLVTVQGRTLGEVRDIFYLRLGQVYSGVRREAGATTRFDVSVANLRAIQVRVLGAVVRPGAYQMSSIGTFLEALYFAGGPTDEGSYRNLLLNRDGDVPVEIDLYPYLTVGNTSGDPLMQTGDVVFVPAVGKQATIQGQVRREAVFELQEGEGLRELIQFAGGVLPDASTRIARVERILSPSDRSQEVERVVVNAPLDSVLAGTRSFDILAGDIVTVFPVSSIVRNTVSVGGSVRRPGQYELEPGMTVGMLVGLADGLLPQARIDRIRLMRLNQSTDEYFVISNETGLDAILEEYDVVDVFAHTQFVGADFVSIQGRVVNPGQYPMTNSMTVGDLILNAGGLLSDADTRQVEVVRTSVDAAGQVEGASVRVALGDPFGRNDQPMSALTDVVEEQDFVIEANDRVFVRVAADRQMTGEVVVLGEVMRPGQYALLHHEERLSNLIARAGGVTARANPNGLAMKRSGTLIGVDFLEMMSESGSLSDPVVQAGDSITVPVLDNTVAVVGSVNFPSRSVYEPGMSVQDALARAGGPTEDADLNHTSIIYPNGHRETVSRFMWIRSYPHIEPGSTIFVPIKQESGSDWAQVLGTTATVLQAAAVNVIAILSLTQNNSTPSPSGN